MNRQTINQILNVLILLALYGFMAVYFDLRYLVTNAVVTGGDTASWQGIAQHMMDVLLPAGRLSGWDMGNFAGYPNFNFYFIPPFLLAVLPAYLFDLPLIITLKWAIMSGIFLYPILTFHSLRRMDYPFPVPIIGTAVSLLFLFNESYTMFGGNTLSTFAGEFCYMFAFSLFIYFIGSLYHGLKNDTAAIKNGMLLGLIGLSHLFVFIPAGFVVMYWFFSRKKICTKYILKMCLTAFGLMAFWMLPLMAYRHPFTTPVYMIWQEYVNSRYALFGAGLILLFTGPRIALQSLCFPADKSWQRATIILAGASVYTVVGLASMAVMYGSKFWYTGLASPTLTDSPWGLSISQIFHAAWLPNAVILSIAVMTVGFIFRNNIIFWKRYAYTTGTVLFIFLTALGVHKFFLMLVSSAGSTDLKSLLLSAKYRYLATACWMIISFYGFFLTDHIRKQITDISKYLDSDRFVMFLVLIGGCLAAYFSAHFLQVPDIRFLPPILFTFLILFSAETIGPWVAAGSRFLKTSLAVILSFLALIIIIFSSVSGDNWFRHNNQGYQGRQGYEEFMKINDYLRHSYQDRFSDPLNAPRVAYEKADGYGIYGGDRVFESLPYFSGRQTLEGIHYASSFASKFIAFLQTEFSRDIKTPTSGIFSHINFNNLPDRFDLYNISQIILLTDTAKKAAEQSSFLVKEKDFGKLSLFRYTNSKDKYVEIPKICPVLYRGDDWVQAFYQRFKVKPADILFIPEQFVEDPEDRAFFQKIVTDILDEDNDQGTIIPDTSETDIETELSNLEIRFSTDKIGVPHLIKVSYFPNWKVTGANGIYPVSPHFMLVIPRQSDVILTYGYTYGEIAGFIISGMTVLICFLAFLIKFFRIPVISALNSLLTPIYNFIIRITDFFRTPLLILIIAVAIAASIGGGLQRNWQVRQFIDANISYSEGIHFQSLGNDEMATHYFKRAIELMQPVIKQRSTIDHWDVINCMLYSAMCHENLNQYDAAIDYYQMIIAEYPYCRAVSEANVKLSRIQRRGRQAAFNRYFADIQAGQTDIAIEALEQGVDKTGQSILYLEKAISEAPFSVWAGYAKDEINQENDLISKTIEKTIQAGGEDEQDREKVQQIWRKLSE
jgi:tetratricopeptide repeat protein